MTYSNVMLRFCLFIPTLVGAVELLNMSTANAIESHVKEQIGGNYSESNFSENLGISTISGIDSLESTSPQGGVEHQSSASSATQIQAVTGATPREAIATPANTFSQVTEAQTTSTHRTPRCNGHGSDESSRSTGNSFTYIQSIYLQSIYLQFTQPTHLSDSTFGCASH